MYCNVPVFFVASSDALFFNLHNLIAKKYFKENLKRILQKFEMNSSEIFT